MADQRKALTDTTELTDTVYFEEAYLWKIFLRLPPSRFVKEYMIFFQICIVWKYIYSSTFQGGGQWVLTMEGNICLLYFLVQILFMS